MGLAKQTRVRRQRQGVYASIAQAEPSSPRDPAVSAFAHDVDDMLGRIGATNVELVLYQIELDGLRPGEARTVAKDTAGPSALWRQTGANRYLMLFVGNGRDGPGSPLGRLRRDLQVLSGQPGLRTLGAEVRQLRRWSHDVINADYLLYELAASAPHSLQPD